MSTLLRRLRRSAVCLGVVALAVALAGREGAPARQAPEGRGDKGPTYQGSGSCSKCHTDPFGDLPEVVLLSEFATWRVHDKHSQAYAVLVGRRGRQMGRVLGVDVTTPEAGCLGCHAVDARREGGKDATDLEKVLLTDGVGCEACHGASSEWLGRHFGGDWRDKTGKEKAEFGLTDLRNPRVQARVCLSCHVGSTDEGKVVTHPMYAAGHPPLPSIEVAEFGENMPRHWYHTKDVPWLKKGAGAKQRKNFGFDEAEFRQTRLALTGAVTALRNSASLFQMRTTPADEFSARRWPELVAVAKEGWKDKGAAVLAENWPELAMTHFDCAACHHDLRVPSWRQERGYKGVPGRATPPEWLRVLLPMAVGASAAKDGAAMEGVLAEFDKACTAVPFGKLTAIGESAPKLVAWCDGVLDALDGAKIDRKSAHDMLLKLCDAPEGRSRDYDTARQVVSLADVVYNDLGRPADTEVGPLLAGLKAKLNLKTLGAADDPFGSERGKLIRELVTELTAREGEKGGKEEFKILLRGAVASNRLSRALTEGEGAKRLGEVNDNELAANARRFADYDPKAVQEALTAIRAHLDRK